MKRKRAAPRRYDDLYSIFSTKLSGDSILSKEDKVNTYNSIKTKISVPSAKEQRLQRKRSGELTTSIRNTCSLVENTIRLKEARIQQLEKHLVIEGKFKNELKLVVGNLEDQLSVEQKLNKVFEQTTVQMKEVIMASDNREQKQSIFKQELALVKKDKNCVEALNKELHLEIKKLLIDKELTIVKHLGDKQAAQANLDKVIKDMYNVNNELELQKTKFTSKEEELSNCVYEFEKLQISYKTLKSKHNEFEEELALNDDNVYELNRRISKHEKALTVMKQTLVETQSLLNEKTEFIKNLQSTINYINKKEDQNAVLRKVDKMIIKQKLEEIEKFKNNLCQFDEQPSESNSCRNLDNIDEADDVKELPLIMEHVEAGNSDHGVSGSSATDLKLTRSRFMDNVILESSSITMESNIFAPIDKAINSFQDCQSREEGNKTREVEKNRLISFYDSPDLPPNEAVIPRPVDYDADNVPVEIVSGKERLALVDKDMKNKQLLAMSELKNKVDEVVNTYLRGFYPRQTKGVEQNWVINSDQEFEQLTKKFSKQFREEVMSEHANGGNDCLVGLVLSSGRKEVMLEQIIFYFCVREEVYKSLIGLIRPTNTIFQFCLSRYSESLILELTDSHVTMGGSLADLAMTDDSRLYIRCHVERVWRFDLEV